MKISFAVASSVLLTLGICLAQVNPQPNQGAAPQKLPDAPSQTRTGQEKEIERQEQSYRVMGVVPHFGTTHLNAPPLTGGEKFHLFVKSAFDPVTFVLTGAQAGIAQAQDSFPAYGQGAEGYGKRYGAAFTDSVSSGFFSNYFYPVLFKQDPRYFRLGEGGFKRRLAHSMVEQVVAHQDSGGRMFHFSNVLGALSSGGISNIYYPEQDRGFGLTMSRAGIAMLYGQIGGIFNEFWPDVQNRIMTKKKLPSLPPGQSPAPSKPVLPLPQ